MPFISKAELMSKPIKTKIRSVQNHLFDTKKLSSMGYVKQDRNGLSYTLDWEEDNLYILEKA